uniref:Replication factor A C-terminal domain-containing protein n=1 Tax=Solanum lycopersicum TaxID=4081 RepID=A0A3Q7EXB5_SOLLC
MEVEVAAIDAIIGWDIVVAECQFELTIKDDTGSTTTMISDKIGEELLSLTVAEIHDILCIKCNTFLQYGWQHHFVLMAITFGVYSTDFAAYLQEIDRYLNLAINDKFLNKPRCILNDAE